MVDYANVNYIHLRAKVSINSVHSKLVVPIARAKVEPQCSTSATIIPGPRGPEGPEGPEGPQGDPGPPGEGVSWWFGDGPPGTILGSRPGDRYLDEISGDVYRLGD